MVAGALLAVEKIVRKNARRIDPRRAQNILILEYRLPLGCLVHMTPVFEAMKRSRPEVRIAVATRGLGLQVLRHSPYIDHLIETPDPTTDLAASIRSLRRELHTRNFIPDCALTGASDQRTKIALLSLLGNSGWRGGYTLAPQIYHHALSYDPFLSLIGNNLRLAHLIGCTNEVTRPRIFASPQDVDHAEAMLRQCNPDGKPVAIFVTQNSGGQSTGWHTDRFAQIIQHVASRGFAILYVGTAAEAVGIDTIRDAAGIGFSLAGKTTVSQLAATVALSDLAVSLDTGPMHVARAAGVPLVVLGPSWQKPLEWLPLGIANVRILRGADRPDVPPGYRLDEIQAGDVIQAADDLIQTYPPSAADRAQRRQQVTSDLDHLPHRA